MRKCAVLFLVLLMVPMHMQAQSVEKILQKHLKAMGGEKNINEVETIIEKGTFLMPMMGVQGEFVIQKKRPNKQTIEVLLPDGSVNFITDGEKVWMVNPYVGVMDPILMEGDDAAAMKRRMEFHTDLIDYKSNGAEITLAGEVEFDSTACYKLVAKRKDGEQISYYVDKDNFLLIGTEMTNYENGQISDLTTKLHDYKKINNIQIAHKLKSLGMQEMNFEVTEVKINEDLPDDIFVNNP